MKNFLIILFAGLVLIQCQNSESTTTDADYTKSFNDWTDEAYNSFRYRSPITLSYQGIKERYDEWSDNSDAEQDTLLQMRKDYLTKLNTFDINKLDHQAKLTYRLMKRDYEQRIENDRYRNYYYPAHQMRGVHSFIPSFMINIHRVTELSDAEAYVTRLEKSGDYLDVSIENINRNESEGILPPIFVFDYIIRSSENIISGKPFSSSNDDSPIFADLKKKVNGLEIDQEQKDALIERGEKALVENLKPAYDRLITLFNEQLGRATTNDGVWKFKDGSAFYKSRLKARTTTDMTADEIFNTGMSEIERIHGEMNAIRGQVGFDGDLQAFFEFMRTDEQFYYPNNAEGKADYLAKANDIINAMKDELDGLFITKPKADFFVKAVEPFRERSAGKAFYQGPALDGSRPGTYYANLYDMSQMPKYQMEALAYHEAIPGHHMQIAIKQELEGLPLYRTLGSGYTAYSEGWGLYSEYIPKELGFYEDPYSDFGRLAMELWRSCRLVVDVGIHEKKWTREEGIDFYKSNTPNPEGDVIKMVERHIVMPGQATAYKIGQMKILSLRQKAKDALGEEFDIRKFHDVVLTNGPVPLDVLEVLVDEYIEAETVPKQIKG